MEASERTAAVFFVGNRLMLDDGVGPAAYDEILAGYDIPETPEQIAKCAYECWQAGASVVHLHMRDDNGAGVMDPVKFYETVKDIRAY